MKSEITKPYLCPEKEPSATDSFQWEIIEKAGRRSLKEYQQLIEEALAGIRKGKIRGDQRISGAESLGEIDLSRTEGKEWGAVSEGVIKFQKVSPDSKVLVVSDIHGEAEDLKYVARQFLELVKQNPDAHFHFGGDIGTGKDQVAVQEVLAGLQTQFPDRFNRVAGNGDRRGASLITGYAEQLVKRFAPEIDKEISDRVDEIMARLKEEGRVPEKGVKVAKMLLYGTQFLRAAKEAGLASLSNEEINPVYLYRIAKGMAGVKTNSQVLNFGVLRPLREALEPTSRFQAKQTKILSPEYDSKALELFRVWQTHNALLNEQPNYVFMDDGENDLAILMHSGVARSGTKLGQLVHDPNVIAESVWAKLVYQEKNRNRIAQYGNFYSYTPQELGDFLRKLIGGGQRIVVVTGHNHENRTDFISLNNQGKTSKRLIMRVEVVSGRSKNAAPEYIIFDFKKFHDNPNNPVLAVERITIPE